jgi:hypothetical protein
MLATTTTRASAPDTALVSTPSVLYTTGWLKVYRNSCVVPKKHSTTQPGLSAALQRGSWRTKMRNSTPTVEGGTWTRADVVVALFVAVCSVLMLASVPVLFRATAAPGAQRTPVTDDRPHLP